MITQEHDMTTLHEMTKEYTWLYDMAADPDADVESFGMAIDALQGEISAKVDGVVAVIRNLEALRDGIEAHIEKQAKRANVADKRAKWLRRYLMECLEELGERRIVSANSDVSIADNPARVEIYSYESIPSEYVVVTEQYRPNKILIKKALLEGAEIPGASLVKDKRISIK
jgi:hypothetical protein